MKAKLLGKVKDKYNKYRTDLMCEYHGKTYVITAYDNGYSETLKEQHKREQAGIDNEIDNPQPIQPYTGEVDKALNELFDYWNT